MRWRSGHRLCLVDDQIAAGQSQHAVVSDKAESRFDLGLCGIGDQAEIETQVAALGVQRIDRGQRGQVAVQSGDLADPGQVAQQRQRVHAVAEGV